MEKFTRYYKHRETGESFTVDFKVDLERLLDHAAARAFRTKHKKANPHGGMIKAVVTEIEGKKL